MATDPALLILASLAEGDKHGYGMMLDIQQFTGIELGHWHAVWRYYTVGEMRLDSSAGIGGSAASPYRITPSGRAYLLEQMTELNRVVKTALGRLKPA